MPHYKELPEILKKWTDAVASGDIDAIVSHYLPNARLKGTIWNEWVGHAGVKPTGGSIDGYFKALYTGKEDVHVSYQAVDVIDYGIYLVDYTFHWTDPKTGEPGALEANGTFVCRLCDSGKEGILLHHSSPFFQQ
tara:strand:- start:46524 stop:46928 length:405 start_codon:yes stop_codon:yes gene_type:complete